MKWFRFYHDAIDDPKVQRLPGDLFKFWMNMLCLSSRSEERGMVKLDLDAIAFATRTTDDEAEAMIAELVKRNLLDETVEGLAVHNWDSRQFKSDNVAERVQKHRGNTPPNGDVTLQETLHVTMKPSVYTDTDTEEIQIQSGGEHAESGADDTAQAPPPTDEPDDPEKPTKRATRLDDSFTVSEGMRAWAVKTGLPDDEVDWETDKFRDYWTEQSGQKGRKVTWEGTWRNWIRRAVEDRKNGKGGTRPSGLTVYRGGNQSPPTYSQRKKSKSADDLWEESLELERMGL